MSEHPQEDLLEQVFTQGLEKIKPPPQEEAEEAAPEAEPSGPGPEPPEGGTDEKRKNRSSAVYLYLLILFGAAFLMLLLAYFVQQRTSENTISGLRHSMNLSREELLAEIKELEDKVSTLEKENAELEKQNDALGDGFDSVYSDLIELRKRYDEQVQDANSLFTQYNARLAELYSWEIFASLERFYLEKDYAACVATLLGKGENYQTPESIQWRYDEIVRSLIGMGILKEDFEQHPEDYKELLDSLMPNGDASPET